MDEKYANGVANEGFTEPGTKGSMGTLDSYAADKSSIGTTATGTTTAGVPPSTVGSQAKLVKQVRFILYGNTRDSNLWGYSHLVLARMSYSSKLVLNHIRYAGMQFLLYLPTGPTANTIKFQHSYPYSRESRYPQYYQNVGALIFTLLKRCFILSRSKWEDINGVCHCQRGLSAT